MKETNKEEKEFNKQYLKELKQAKEGKIKAVAFYNKYKNIVWCLPCYLKRFYEFDLRRGDIKIKELEKEQFKEILKIEKKIKKLQNKKEEFLKEVLK